MDDTIYRQAAIDVLEERLQASNYSNVALVSELNRSIGYLMRLPSAQPEPRWIPCEERLPENGHYYLWCSDMGSVQSDYYWNGFENGMKYGYNIVAWMPLPEPYKEDSDG